MQIGMQAEVGGPVSVLQSVEESVMRQIMCEVKVARQLLCMPACH
jgi:hypothetical protein